MCDASPKAGQLRFKTDGSRGKLEVRRSNRDVTAATPVGEAGLGGRAAPYLVM